MVCKPITGGLVSVSGANTLSVIRSHLEVNFAELTEEVDVVSKRTVISMLENRGFVSSMQGDDAVSRFPQTISNLCCASKMGVRRLLSEVACAFVMEEVRVVNKKAVRRLLSAAVYVLRMVEVNVVKTLNVTEQLRAQVGFVCFMMAANSVSMAIVENERS